MWSERILSGIEKKAADIKNCIPALRMPEADADIKAEVISELVNKSEELAIMARRLPCMETETDEEECFPDKFTMESDFRQKTEHFTFTTLLPGNESLTKRSTHNEYLQKTIGDALIKEIGKSDTTRNFYKTRTVAWFIHFYSGKRPDYDVDNLERKKVIDIISPFYMTDDRLLNQYVSVEKGEYPHTELYLIPEEMFPDALKTITEEIRHKKGGIGNA